jgi:hypothetical protein
MENGERTVKKRVKSVVAILNLLQNLHADPETSSG